MNSSLLNDEESGNADEDDGESDGADDGYGVTELDVSVSDFLLLTVLL